MYLQKVISKKTWHLKSHGRKEHDPEPDPDSEQDPLVKGTDPMIRIRTYQNVTDPEHWGISKKDAHSADVRACCGLWAFQNLDIVLLY
jgi:hypothetical protein